jgi:hypothetical protein
VKWRQKEGLGVHAHYLVFFLLVELAAEIRVQCRGPDGNRKSLLIHLILDHHALPCESSTIICATSYTTRDEIESVSVPMDIVFREEAART